MMIKTYVILDTAGIYPSQIGTHLHLPEGAFEVAGDVGFYLDKILLAGQWLARPKIAEPTVSAGGVVSFADVPTGAIATITDIAAQCVIGTVPAALGLIEFQLVDPATYQIEVTAPLPWLGWIGSVSC